MAEGTHACGTDATVRLFRAAGFVTDTPGTERPTAPLTVYRGCLTWRRRGVSWTLKQDRATFYAERHARAHGGQGARVYAATIPTEHVLGIFLERQEAEIVLDPRRLQKLREA